MTGESVCEVLASDRPGYAAGDIVLAHTGWRTHAAWDGPAPRKLDPKLAPITTGLGVLGMPGFTAYSGSILDRQAESRATPWSSPPRAARSARWSGSSPRWPAPARSALPAAPTSAATSSKTCASTPPSIIAPSDFPAQLVAACPKGIDVYFENVGGAVWQAVLPLLNTYARVPVCGLIAQYSVAGAAAGPNLLPATMRAVLTKSLTLRGFINYEFAAEHYAEFPANRFRRHRRWTHPLPRRHHRRAGKRPGRLHGPARREEFRQGAGSRHPLSRDPFSSSPKEAGRMKTRNCYSAGCFGFGLKKVRLRLSHSSILAPLRCMITLCCATESELFHAQ